MEIRTKNNKPVLSRDLSWLAFNYRVLQEAKNKSVPLLERIRFLAIFSANLDEFFKVRVATLRRLLKLKKKTRSLLLHQQQASDELNEVMREIGRQQREFGEILRDNILTLREENIYLITEKELTDEQRTFAQTYFAEKLQPLLRPVFLNNGQNHLFLKDQTVFMVAELQEKHSPTGSPVAFALMEVPVHPHGGRFVQLPAEDGKQFVMFMDDVIRIGLPQLFPECDILSINAIKISRDADLDIGEDVSGNLLAKIQRNLKKREKGSPSRLLIDPDMPIVLLELLKQKTGCATEEVVIGSQYHNFRDLFTFPGFDRPDLEFAPQPPLPHPDFPEKESVFTSLSGKESLLHFPYQSYEPVVRFFQEAATDPSVSAISCTLYRVAHQSKIAKALIKAARSGKFVTVLVELLARFDEESNIKWARKLERAGAYVIYGVPGHKVHCKLALVTRREANKNVNYAYLSTGNFNEYTARIYTDYGLFTTDVRLIKEIDQIFQYFIDRGEPQQFQHLLVAPFTLRKKLNRLIQKEIKNAEKGKPALIILKLNSLQDEKMIEKLYEASQAGVKIELIVRGICTLIPGKKGLSENIKVRSLVDRYLEHTRVYLFGNSGKEKMYISSADWMTRNLSRRIEVAFPIYDPALREQIRADLKLQLRDNVKARKPDNRFIIKAGPKLQSQPEIYRKLQEDAAET